MQTSLTRTAAAAIFTVVSLAACKGGPGTDVGSSQDGTRSNGTTSDANGDAGCLSATKQCPDGTTVNAIGPGCGLFEACPGATPAFCDPLQKTASDAVEAAIDKHSACTQDSDCVLVAQASDCFDECERAMNKDPNAASDVSAAVSQVNGSQCQQFLAQGCTFDHPPCVPETPHCVNKVCQ